MESQKSIIDNWYITTLYELINGESITELEYVLKEFEKEEAYLECAGIKKALDLAENKTVKELRLDYKELLKTRIKDEK